MIGRILSVGLLTIVVSAFGSGGGAVKLKKAQIDHADNMSLQRGFKYYVNLCLGCHTLKYSRYKQMAKDIHLTDLNGEVDQEILDRNLIFSDVSTSSMIINSMPMLDAQKWFGVAPPDLSLITRVRGENWVYSYLLGFYKDDNRPWGVNNVVFPDVGMPNVLAPYQGIQELSGGHDLDHLRVSKSGSMNEHQFAAMVNDITNFLSFVATPYKQDQNRIGIFVIIFLLIFSVFAYYLKKEFWKDVK